jgi:hypothetical protein
MIGDRARGATTFGSGDLGRATGFLSAVAFIAMAAERQNAN